MGGFFSNFVQEISALKSTQSYTENISFCPQNSYKINSILIIENQINLSEYVFLFSLVTFSFYEMKCLL